MLKGKQYQIWVLDGSSDLIEVVMGLGEAGKFSTTSKGGTIAKILFFTHRTSFNPSAIFFNPNKSKQIFCSSYGKFLHKDTYFSSKKSIKKKNVATALQCLPELVLYKKSHIQDLGNNNVFYIRA